MKCEMKFGALKEWFENYTGSFVTDSDEALNDAVDLKKEHTLRVVEEIEMLGNSIELSNDCLYLAKITALLHDIGRFEQFKLYRTFSDKKSQDHAGIGLKVIKNNDLLAGIEKSVANLIRVAIKYHNAAVIPEMIENEEKKYCRLIRDADKLDIYRILADHYTGGTKKRKDTVEIGIADGCQVSKEICEAVARGNMVPYEKIRTINDFKIIQIGWVYDLNFPLSAKLICKRGHFDMIKKTLPETELVIRAVSNAEDYMKKVIEKA